MSNVDTQRVNQAAAVLAGARQQKALIQNIPAECRPADIDTALAIQNRTMDLIGERIGGWKCGLQAKPDMIMLAPIPAGSIYHASPVAVVGAPGKIEPEIAFVLGKDLPARATPYTEPEIRAAIGDVRFVLELLGARFEKVVDVTYHELLADCYNNYGLFIGASIPGALDQPLETLPVKITTPNAVIVDREGKHPSGHPMNSFSWLVNYLSAHGRGMKAGETITTGSYAGVVEVPIGENIRVELGKFPAIEVRLSA